MIAEELLPFVEEYICRPEKGKGARGIKQNWSYKRALAEKQRGEYICASIDLSNSDNIICIDIDENYDMDKYLKEHNFPDYLRTKGNTKGFHYYLQTDDKVFKNVVKVHKNDIEGDYLGMKVWERVNKEWIGKMIDTDDFKKVIEWDKVERKTIEKVERVYAPPDMAMLDGLVQMIDEVYIHTTKDWRKIVWAMKKCGFEKEYANAWSMRSGVNAYSSGYSIAGFEGVWEQYSVDNINLTEGTIKYYAKLSNPEEYAKLVWTPMFKYDGETTDEDFANLYFKLDKNSIRMDDSRLYVYIEDTTSWVEVTDKKSGVIRRKIGNALRPYFLDDMEKFKKEVDDAKKRMNTDDEMKYTGLLKSATKNFKKLGMVTHISSITKTTLDKVADFDFNTTNLFDNHPDIFAFKNQAFNLKDRMEYTIQKEDYITQNTGRDWIMPEEEQVEEMDTLFKKIFPDEDMRKCYLSVLRSGLSGTHLEKFIVANGSGRNGKGLLNELMFHLLGPYAYKLQVDTLTKSMNRTGASPEVANLHKKRFVVSCEPEDGTKFQMGNIKDLTGSDEVVARGLYQSDTRTCLNGTLVVECNKRPEIAGRIDRAVMERMVEVQFRNAFVSNPKDVDEKQGIYLANTEYKTREWKEKMYCALFVYILQNGEETLYVPDSVREITKKYILGSDELYSLIMESYQETDDEEAFVRETELYDLVRESDVYANMTKAEKRGFNKKRMGEMLKENVIFGKQYRTGAGYNKKTKQKYKCNRIMGYVLRDEDASDDDDE